MYSKAATKSYKRDVSPRKSYKKNVLPPGVTDLTSSLLGSKVMSDASDLFRRGKKSKLARSLAKKNPIASAEQYGLMLVAAKGGSDKVDKQTAIEFIKKTPAKMRRKYAKELAARRNNPDEAISPEVEDLSKEWHGRDVKYYEDVQEVETYEKDLVNLGLLEELGVLDLGLITFKKDQPIVCCDGEGHNLEIVGGDQCLDLDKEGIEFAGKRLVPLGYLYSIVYVTDKHHLEGSNGYPEPYEHFFAEEYYKEFLNPDSFKEMSEWFDELSDMGVVDKAVAEGRLPMAVYDKTDEKIIISGGGYEVTDLGIKD